MTTQNHRKSLARTPRHPLSNFRASAESQSQRKPSFAPDPHRRVEFSGVLWSSIQTHGIKWIASWPEKQFSGAPPHRKT